MVPASPDGLSSALAGSNLQELTTRFLAIMALVDGVLDKAKLSKIFGFAEALGVRQRYLDQLTMAFQNRLPDALADMNACNKAAVALAAKIARIAWVVIIKPGATYQRRGRTAA